MDGRDPDIRRVQYHKQKYISPLLRNVYGEKKLGNEKTTKENKKTLTSFEGKNFTEFPKGFMVL